MRLPFGITSAPEHFQCQMAEILQDMEGVVCHMDDILVHDKIKDEHGRRLKAVYIVCKNLALPSVQRNVNFYEQK